MIISRTDISRLIDIYRKENNQSNSLISSLPDDVQVITRTVSDKKTIEDFYNKKAISISEPLPKYINSTFIDKELLCVILEEFQMLLLQNNKLNIENSKLKQELEEYNLFEEK